MKKKKSWKTFQTRSVPSLAHVCVGRKRYGALRGQTGFRWCAGQQICHHRGSNLIDSRFSLRKRRAVCAWASTSDGIYFIVRKRFLYRFSWPNRAPTASAKSMTTNWQLGFCFFSRASRKPNDFIKTFLLISFPKDCPARVFCPGRDPISTDEFSWQRPSQCAQHHKNYSREGKCVKISNGFMFQMCAKWQLEVIIDPQSAQHCARSLPKCASRVSMAYGKSMKEAHKVHGREEEERARLWIELIETFWNEEIYQPQPGILVLFAARGISPDSSRTQIHRLAHKNSCRFSDCRNLSLMTERVWHHVRQALRSYF